MMMGDESRIMLAYLFIIELGKPYDDKRISMNEGFEKGPISEKFAKSAPPGFNRILLCKILALD